jgi:predicted MPP superfamily phosphohydrolase
MTRLTTPRAWLSTIGRGASNALRSLTSAVRSRRAATVAAVVAVTLVGVILGVALGGRTMTEVGPFHAEFRLSPSLSGDTAVHIPPLGSLHFNSHSGPTRLTVELGSLDQARTQAMIDDPGQISRISQTVADDILNGIIRLGFGGLGAGVLGAMVLAALVFRNVRRVAWAGGIATAVLAGSLGAGAATVRLSAIEEPRYEGLLINAPALVGDVQRIAEEWDEYAAGLQRMVANVSLLYTTISTLPVFEPEAELTRVLHVADLHLNPNAWAVMQTVVEQYDIAFIIDSGDIVDWGTGHESWFVEPISEMGVPYVFVRGNHDSEAITQAAVAAQPNAIVLDNDVITLEGLTIAGIGDPRFTPDRSTDPFAEDPDATRQRVIDTGARLADTINRHRGLVHIAAVHDPLMAGPLDGVVRYVLAGHAHDRRVGPVVEPDEGEDRVLGPADTLLMVQGSTGGAGLRGLEGEHPRPLAMSVLYFDDEQRLVAYDDISIGGHGLSEMSLQRHIVERGGEGGGILLPQAPETPTPVP